MDDSIVWSTQSESQFFERKSAWSRSGGRDNPRKVDEIVTDILDVLSAMANADGGELVVGIEDDGLATGVPHSDVQIQAMCDAPGRSDLIAPALDYEAKVVDLPEGERLLHFGVHPSCDVHTLADGRCLLRICDANVPLSGRQVPGLTKTKTQRAVERVVVDGADVHNLNFARVADVLGEGDAVARLHALDLVVVQDGQVVPRLVALLLFADQTARWHKQVGVVFQKWEDEAEAPVVTQAFWGPLVDLPQRVFDFMHPHMPSRNRFPVGWVPTYPTHVWQEAIVNAILHRDYGATDRQIEIRLFADRLEICSPGLPPRPITANRLNRTRGFHVSRNPLLFRVWHLLGDGYEAGVGTVLMRRAMAREGLAAPVFDRYDGRMLRLTLFDRSIYNEMLLAWLARFVAFDLTDAQQRVLAYARLHGYRFTIGHFAKLMDVDFYVASEAIAELVRKGVVRALQKTDDEYRVLEPLYVSSDISAFLVPRLKNKGWLANRHVRRGLGVRRQTARRLLHLWCEENWLIKKGKSAQTVYVPGPKFTT